MIVIKFGTWTYTAKKYFIYERILWKGYKWTPFCIMEKRRRYKKKKPTFTFSEINKEK